VLFVLAVLLFDGASRTGTAPEVSPEPSDEELMARFAAGDAKAFRVLMKRYQRKVYGFIFKMFYDEDRANEVFQESFLKVIRAAGSFDPSQRFSTWLFTVVRNACYDSMRKRRLRTISLDGPAYRDDRDRTVGEVLPNPTSPSGEATAKTRQFEERLRAALDRLNPDQKEVFLLRQFEGMQFNEIGALMGTPENTAKTRMRYALEALRKELKEFL
jgi:RNA polymerase sigma-70 factor (ECF subfamily)